MYPLPSKERYGGAGNEVDGRGGSGAKIDEGRRERRGGAAHGRWQARPEVDGEVEAEAQLGLGLEAMAKRRRGFGGGRAKRRRWASGIEQSGGAGPEESSDLI